jgi:hypothetical protein
LKQCESLDEIFAHLETKMNMENGQDKLLL